MNDAQLYFAIFLLFFDSGLTQAQTEHSKIDAHSSLGWHQALRTLYDSCLFTPYFFSIFTCIPYHESRVQGIRE